jgi:chromosome segregation ATPase
MADSQPEVANPAAASAMEQHNLQSSAAYQQLHELEQEGKITPEKCELYKQKFFELHRIMMKNMETETLRTKKARNLTKQLNNENLKLEKAQQQ